MNPNLTSFLTVQLRHPLAVPRVDFPATPATPFTISGSIFDGLPHPSSMIHIFSGDDLSLPSAKPAGNRRTNPNLTSFLTVQLRHPLAVPRVDFPATPATPFTISGSIDLLQVPAPMIRIFSKDDLSLPSRKARQEIGA